MAAELAIIAKLQDEASSGIRALRGEVEGLGDSGGIAAKGFQALQTVGVAAIAAIGTAAVAAGAAIASSIGVAADFQDAVTLLAIAAKGAGESFDSMRDAAMAVGADTSLVGVSAAGAAEAMTTLYKAGLTTGEIFGDLNGYLAGNAELSGALRAAIDGAAASELSMAQAADLAAITLATFGGEMKTTEERAAFVNMAMNNFVQAADASLASVADLAAAMGTIGPTAAQFGFSLQDTNTALAILSTRGIKGAEAGTALKSMLNNLMSTTPGTTKALNELGVSIYNADGTMRQLPQIIGDLSQALYGLNERTVMVGGRTAEQNHQLELAQKSYAQATDAIYKHNAGLKTLTDAQLAKYISQQSAANAEIQRLEAITGKATTAVSQLTEEQRNQYIATLAGSYGMKAMATLLMEGTEGWTAMEKAIAAAATIQEVARARTETFSGAMEALDGVIETIRIGIGSAFLPVLTALARAFADLAASSLPMIVDTFEAFGGALASFFDAIMGGTPVITAFADSVAGMAEMLGMPAEQAAALKGQIEGVLTAVGNVLGPIAQAVTSFVSWKDVLVVLGIAIASVVIPVLWGIIQVVAPIVAVFAGLVLAVALVRNAFETNFLGIQTLALNLWSALQGVFEGIRALLSGDTTAAMAAFRSAWESGWAAVTAFVETAGVKIGAALVGLWNSIVAWFQGVDWAGLGQSLVEKFFAGMAALGQAAAGRWEWLLTSITSFIQSVDWGKLGYTLVDLLVKGIVGAVGLIATAVAGIVTFIWNFITGTDWIQLGVNLVGAVIEGLRSFGEGAGAALAEWQQGIFDWAETEDWSGVAGKVAELVGAELGNASSNIISTLDSWEQEIFGWAGAEDWGDVAESIADKIGAELSESHDKVTEKLSGWIQAFTDWVETVNWYQVGYDIMYAITDAFLDFKTAVSEKIATWQADLKTQTEGYSWLEIGAYILAQIALAAEGLVSDWTQAVGAWVGNIGSAIANAVGNLSQIGRDIVAGIAAGISGGWDLIQGALAGIGARAAEETPPAFQQNSPSRFAIPVGVNIDAGVALGITQGVGLIIDAINGVASAAELEGVKAFGEAMTAIAEGIGAALSAALDVSAFGGVGSGFGAALESLAAVMGMMVDVVAGANSLGAEALEELVKFVQVAEEINALLLAAADVATYLAMWRTPDMGAVVGSVNALVGYLVVLTGAFAEASVYGAVVVDLLDRFVDVVGKIVSLIQPIVDGIKYLSNATWPDWVSFVHRVEGLAPRLTLLANGLASAIQMGLGSMDLLDRFIEVIGNIAAQIRPIVDMLNYLSNATWPDWISFVHRVDSLAPRLMYLTVGLVKANQLGTLALEGLGVFIEVIGEIAAQIRPIVEMLNFLGGATWPDWISFVHRVDSLAPRLMWLTIGLAKANQLGTLALEELQVFIEVAGEIAAQIKPIVEMLNFLGGATWPDWTSFVRATDALAGHLTLLVAAFEAANQWTESALQELKLFVGVVEDVVGVVEEAIVALGLIAGYSGNTATIGGAIARFTADLVALVATLGAGFAAASVEMGTTTGLAAEFAGHAEDILDVVEPGLEALAALAGYVGASGAVLAVWRFATDLMMVVGALGLAFAAASAEMGTTTGLAAEFAGHAEDILGVVEPGLEALAALATFAPIAMIVGAARVFGEQLVGVVTAIANAFAAASAETVAAVETAAEFAGHAEDILDVVETGIEALVALAAYVPATGVQAAVSAFAADLVIVVTALVDALSAAGILANSAVTEAGEMAGALGDIVDVVAPAVEAVVALVGYTTVGGLKTNAQQFASDLVIVVQTLVDGLSAAGMLANAAVTEAGEMAKSIEAILKTVEPALHPDKGALPLLAKYISSTGLAAKAQQFTADLIAVTQILVDGLTQSALAAGVGLAKAGEMAEAMKKLFEATKPALGVISALEEYTAAAGLQQKAARFTADLVAVTTTLVSGLTAAATDLGGAAIGAAQQFAAGAAAIAGAMFTALSTLATIADTGKNPDIQPQLAYLVKSAEQIVGAFAAAGDIGAAVGYAAAFRANLEQLVAEVQMAVAQLTALAGAGTSGSVQGALAAIAGSLMNTEGQFAGAGSALATALIAAMQTGVAAGQGAVMGAVVVVLGATEAAGMVGARKFEEVGGAMMEATADGVMGGQSRVIAAVVQVVASAIAAGLGEARKAGVIGEEVIRAVLAEVNGGRSALDQSGVSAGTALIDGMVRAIIAGKSRLVNAIKDAVNSAVAAAKAALGIASPSKVAFALMDNFMQTAAGRLGRGDELAAAVGRSIDAAMGAAATRLAGAKLAAPVAVNAGLSRTPVMPSVLPRPTTAGAGPERSFGGGSINIYGNIVLPNVGNPVSFLEELDALRGGGR